MEGEELVDLAKACVFVSLLLLLLPVLTKQ